MTRVSGRQYYILRYLKYDVDRSNFSYVAEIWKINPVEEVKTCAKENILTSIRDILGEALHCNYNNAMKNI